MKIKEEALNCLIDLEKVFREYNGCFEIRFPNFLEEIEIRHTDYSVFCRRKPNGKIEILTSLDDCEADDEKD